MEYGTRSDCQRTFTEKTDQARRSDGSRLSAPYTSQTRKRILALLDQWPPKGYARWTGPLLAARLGDVDVQYVWLCVPKT
jgi:hypothetical protein